VQHKAINYLENIIIKKYIDKNRWDEGVFLNDEGFVAEGTKSNLFIVIDDKVITPDVDSGILPGITRAKIIDICKKERIEVQERKVTLGELCKAHEYFMCNSLMGVMPVSSIDVENMCYKFKNSHTVDYLRKKYLIELDKLV